MRKITWDDLTIEITRRCQLKCQHCFRGQKQNIDISKETIDHLLNQTEVIGRLAFTGGEPTLNLDMMEYFLEQLYERRIPLFKLHIITNGFEKSERFVELVKSYSEMIQLCYLDADIDIEYYVTIGISDDKYHVGVDIADAIKYYKKNLKGYAKVLPARQGRIPVASGNAKNLPEAILPENNEELDTRIEVLSKDMTPMCPYFKTYNLLHENQIYIVCEMQVSAKGDLTLYRVAANDDYNYEDTHTICNVSENIYEKIIEYNKDKPSCIEKMRIKKEIEEKKRSDPTWIFKRMIQGMNASLFNPSFEDDLADLMADKHISDPLEHAEDVIDGNYNDMDSLYSKSVNEVESEIYKYFNESESE